MRREDERLVTPFYRRVLNGNLLAEDPARRRSLVAQMRDVAADVTFEHAVRLWAQGWRQALMASWWAAVHRWPAAVAEVRGLLIPSRTCYAGQAHCVALARIGSPPAAAVLTDYLDRYLPRHDLQYDQPWAMAALAIVEPGAAQPMVSTNAWGRWHGAQPWTPGLDAMVVKVTGMIAVASAVAGDEGVA